MFPINAVDVANLIKKFISIGEVLTKNEMKEMVSYNKEYLQDDVDKVHHIINENPHSSIRRTALRTGMNYSKVCLYAVSVGKLIYLFEGARYLKIWEFQVIQVNSATRIIPTRSHFSTEYV